jgi:hypothetical protein
MHRQKTITTSSALLLLVAAAFLAASLPVADAFVPRTSTGAAANINACNVCIRPSCAAPRRRPFPSTTSTALRMARMGPLARAKKMMDPDEYNRVVEQKMAQDGLTRQQAEAEYNQFLENPPFYYALDKKADCTCCRWILICLDRIGWLAVVIDGCFRSSCRDN